MQENTINLLEVSRGGQHSCNFWW